jgi:hypothetical protein
MQYLTANWFSAECEPPLFMPLLIAMAGGIPEKISERNSEHPRRCNIDFEARPRQFQDLQRILSMWVYYTQCNYENIYDIGHGQGHEASWDMRCHQPAVVDVSSTGR